MKKKTILKKMLPPQKKDKIQKPHFPPKKTSQPNQTEQNTKKTQQHKGKKKALITKALTTFSLVKQINFIFTCLLFT